LKKTPIGDDHGKVGGCFDSMLVSTNIEMFPKIGGFPPKSSILIGFSMLNHPFWGTLIFGNTHIGPYSCFSKKQVIAETAMI